MPASPQRELGRVSVLVAPTSDPLALDGEVKKHLRIDHEGENDELLSAVKAAVQEIDAPHGWLGRSLITRTLRLTLDGYPPSVVYLPGPPVTEVKKITVRESDDTLEVIYDADLSIDTIGLMSDLTAEPALIWPDDAIGWPADVKGGVDSVRIDYVAGYADADAVPSVIKQWLLMRVGELYRDRELSALGVAESRLTHADRMLDNWRVRA
jgi:uncharacterized phiE125 gp8 family phage protein